MRMFRLVKQGIEHAPSYGIYDRVFFHKRHQIEAVEEKTSDSDINRMEY